MRKANKRRIQLTRYSRQVHPLTRQVHPATRKKRRQLQVNPDRSCRFSCPSYAGPTSDLSNLSNHLESPSFRPEPRGFHRAVEWRNPRISSLLLNDPCRQPEPLSLTMIISMIVMVVMMFIVVAVIFMIPMTLVHPPSLLVVVIVRMAPIGAGVGRPIPAAGNPDIPSALVAPITIHPAIAFPRVGWANFVAQRRRRLPDINPNLTKRRNCKNCRSDASD